MAQNISKALTATTYRLPVFGNGSDVKLGAMLMRGATPATENGTLKVASGAGADIIGRLGELHDYSVVGDTLVDGTSFVTHPVNVAHGFRIFRMEYDQADTLATTQAVTTTTMTLTSLEDNIDAGFWYVVSGDGIGQTNYSTASASGSCTLKAAFGTSLGVGDTLIKILPRFHPLGLLNSDATKLGSNAAAGSWTIYTIDTHIERNGRIEQMDPTKHDALSGLNSTRGLKFWADVAIRNTMPYTID